MLVSGGVDDAVIVGGATTMGDDGVRIPDVVAEAVGVVGEAVDSVDIDTESDGITSVSETDTLPPLHEASTIVMHIAKMNLVNDLVFIADDFGNC